MPERDNVGRNLISATIGFVGLCIVVFGIVQIMNGSRIPGVIILCIGLFDWAILAFVIKKL